MLNTETASVNDIVQVALAYPVCKSHAKRLSRHLGSWDDVKQIAALTVLQKWEQAKKSANPVYYISGCIGAALLTACRSEERQPGHFNPDSPPDLPDTPTPKPDPFDCLSDSEREEAKTLFGDTMRAVGPKIGGTYGKVQWRRQKLIERIRANAQTIDRLTIAGYS